MILTCAFYLITVVISVGTSKFSTKFSSCSLARFTQPHAMKNLPWKISCFKFEFEGTEGDPASYKLKERVVQHDME